MDNWNDYINKEFKCQCGKVHSCAIEHVVIEENAFNRFSGIMAGYDYRNITVICDVNTRKIVGEKVFEVLEKQGFSYKVIEFPDEFLIPDENAVGRIMVQIDKDCDLLIAAGSGTIKDLCSYTAHMLGIDYFVAASAPSMDGYASNVSPLIVNYLKTTYEAKMPRVIIGDVNILKEAPLHMIAAGAGDVIGKYISLADWQISHLVTGEYFCPYAASLVNDSISSVMSGVKGVKARDSDAVKKIMEGLVLSGIVMSYIGNSRPASGSEHHLAHYWEMISILNGKPWIALHGTKVGIGTVECIKMYKQLKEAKDLQARTCYDFEKWKNEIIKAYEKSYGDVIGLEEKVGKNSKENVEDRVNRFLENRDKINEIIEALPETEEIEGALRSMDAPVSLGELGFDSVLNTSVLNTSILYAKDLRTRYGLLQMLYDFDLYNAIFR